MLVIWPKWFGFFVVSLMFASVTVGVSGAVTAGSETFGFAKFGVLNILKVCAAKSRFKRSCRTKVFEKRIRALRSSTQSPSSSTFARRSPRNWGTRREFCHIARGAKQASNGPVTGRDLGSDLFRRGLALREG